MTRPYERSDLEVFQLCRSSSFIFCCFSFLIGILPFGPWICAPVVGNKWVLSCLSSFLLLFSHELLWYLGNLFSQSFGCWLFQVIFCVTNHYYDQHRTLDNPYWNWWLTSWYYSDIIFYIKISKKTAPGIW